MDTKYSRALTLNADYTPLGTISWERAITLAIKNQENAKRGVVVVDFYKAEDAFVKSENAKHPIPAVVTTAKYIRKKRDGVKFSRKNVFIRDQMRCQYCDKVFPFDELTYDHVVPRTKWNPKYGTPTNWENIVTSCKPCNNRKADHLPHEVGMRLLHVPKKPNPQHYILGISPWSYIPDEWRTYLTPIYKDIF